ncbi:three-Cys-motif partner protein TcmP, partial [bacterium]|nr:three-Cys-motif partner protein TcmP [bacterium]
MVVPKETVWSLKPHTKAKHEILRRYLGAWFAILNKYNHRIIYLDGFCGPGRYKDGEPGSPVIALEVAIHHRKLLEGELAFWFIDEREDRIANLQHELQKKEIPHHFNVKVECNRFHEKLSSFLDSIDDGIALPAPTFAFIDPFGFSGIPFSLIERLLNQRSCEVLIIFQIDAINRFLEHPRDEVVRHIVDAFGTEDVIRIAELEGDRIVELQNLYQLQLQKVAEFVRFFEMHDRKDRLQYLLFFATNNELGHVKMKE